MSNLSLYAQGDLDDDEPWDLENLDPTELDSIQNEQKIEYHNSSGWFPSTWGFDMYIGIDYQSQSVFDGGQRVLPTGAVDLGFRYDPSSALPEDEIRSMYYPLTDRTLDTLSGEYGPERSAYRIGFSTMMTTGLPLWIELSANYFSSTNIAYVYEPNKRYRNRDGTISRFREGHYLVFDSWGVGYGATAHIPVYGAFISMQGIETFNTYEIFIGFEQEMVLSHCAGQYAQIEGDAGLNIRYDNTRDTVVISRDLQLENVNQFRSFLPIGISWNVGGGPVQFNISLSYDISLNNLFTDKYWWSDRLSNRFGFRINPWWQ